MGATSFPWPRVRHVRPRARLFGRSGVLVAAGLLALSLPGTTLAQDRDDLASERWQRAELPFLPAGLQLWDVIAGGPGFIAVGGGFESGRDVGTALIMVSEDGHTWQSVPLFGEAATGIPRSLTATPDGFVAVGSGCCPDEAAVWLSEDGLVWERLPDQPGFAATAMFDVTASADGLVAVGCSAVMECFAGLAWTSPDGRHWSEPVELDLLPAGVSTTWAGVVAVGVTEPYEGGPAVTTSIDGSTWSAVTQVASNGALQDAVETLDAVLAMGGTTRPRDGRAMTLAVSSPDGQAWEPLEVAGSEGVWVEDIVPAPSGWLLVGWSAGRSGQLPATLWTADFELARTIRFPREVKAGGLLHAGAVGDDGLTMVAVGSTVLNRGEVPAAWVRSVPPSPPGR